MGYSVLLFHESPDYVDLVLHQCDQGGDDDRGTGHDEGWQLEAKRLSTACGHEHKCVFPFQKVADNGFLIPLEGVKSEEFFQFGVEDGGIYLHDWYYLS